MSQAPKPSDDFASPEPPESTASTTGVPVWAWVLGGLGCGCLSLIILGILAAIALPTFLNQAQRAKESEGRNYTGTMMRAQQAYFLENGEYAPTIEQLELGLAAETELYLYRIELASDPTAVFIYAEPRDETLRGFVGAIYNPDGDVGETGFCESDVRGQAPPEPPTFADDVVTCGPGSTSLQ